MSAFLVWNVALLLLYLYLALHRVQWQSTQLGILAAWFLFLLLAAVAQGTGQPIS